MVQVQGGHVSQLSRSATARRGELGVGGGKYARPLRPGAGWGGPPGGAGGHRRELRSGGLSAGRGERLCGSGGREAACSSVIAALDA